MGDLPKKNNGLIVWVTYPRGRILSKLHDFLRNSFNMRSLLATFLDECRSTRSLLAISNNLESHLAIPFIQSWNIRSFLATFIEIWDPFWRSPLAKQLGIPSGDSFYTKAEIWGPFWRPPLMNIENETPSGDLKQLGIPSGDSFYSELKYEVPSGDLHRNTRSLLAISTTWNHIWWFLLFKTEIWGPFWRPPSKYETPSGDLNNLESHLAIPFI